MWIEKYNDKFRAIERYIDPLTLKTKRVSVIINKNTKQQQKIAQQTLDQLVIKKTSYTTSHGISLGNLIKEYLDEKKSTVKLSTYKRDSYVLASVENVLGEDAIVDNLTVIYVKKKFNSAGKGPKTINEWITRFKAMIRWGYKNEIIKCNSCAEKLDLLKIDTSNESEEDKFLDSAELQSLVNGMTVEKWELLTLFLAYSGMRIGEAIALTTSDVDIKTRKININKTYDSNNKVITSAKTASSKRTVMIQDELLPICLDIIKYMKQNSTSVNFLNQPFFHDENGAMIQYDSYRQYLGDCGERILGKRVTPHILRHTHTSLAAQEGMALDVIARRLGHKKSEITQRVYLHTTQAVLNADYQQLNGIKLNIKRRKAV